MDIFVNKNEKTPLYLQVYNAIKDMVESGELEIDTKLPPIRLLANQLGVNNTTVVSAYQKLTDEGITYKVRGSGCYVAPKAETLIAEISSYENPDNYLPIKHMRFEGSEKTINFATATPRANLFPVTDFKKSLNAVLDRDMGEAFSYQEVKGYYPLRESILMYLDKQGIETSIEQIQVISGAQQGLDIVAKSVLNYNDVVIVEAPTYSGAIATFRSRGVKIVEVPMLVDGVNIKKLEELVKRHNPKLMYTMTNCQNPTGYTYSQRKKSELLELASKYDFLILEDDYVGELMYTKSNTHTLKAIDSDDKVIYIKSFSKILMPGLRLGFMIVPEPLDILITNAKQATDISTSGLIQRAFDLYLRNGNWEKQLINMKKVYYRRFKKMIEMLDLYLPRTVKYYVPKGGILFWVELPKGLDSRELSNRLDSDLLIIVPGDVFFFREKKTSMFRISIAAVSTDEIEQGVIELSRNIAQFIKDKELE